VRATVALGLALALAFSPAVYDLVRHWLANPWSSYSAVFVALPGWLAWRSEGARPQRAAGFGLLAAGLVLQLLAALAVMPALGRPALALAVAGFLLLRGLAPPGVALLALFAVPVPHTFADLTGGDAVAPELFRAASDVLRLVGVTVAAGSHEVVAGAAVLDVDSSQAGLPVAVAMVGLAAYAHLRGAPARWLPAIVAAGVVAHFAAVVVAEGLLAAGLPGAAGLAVDLLGWLVPTAVVVRRLEAGGA